MPSPGRSKSLRVVMFLAFVLSRMMKLASFIRAYLLFQADWPKSGTVDVGLWWLLSTLLLCGVG
jgi:hypothetical protein